MAKKKDTEENRLVYSTDPGFPLEQPSAEVPTLAAGSQQLRIVLETRHRAGKVMTVIKGFTGKSDDLEALAKQLKNHCGTGGSVKDGEMLIQGDHTEKVLQWLLRQGYTHTKKAGR